MGITAYERLRVLQVPRAVHDDGVILADGPQLLKHPRIVLGGEIKRHNLRRSDDPAPYPISPALPGGFRQLSDEAPLSLS
jgi:hypothetical protein